MVWVFCTRESFRNFIYTVDSNLDIVINPAAWVLFWVCWSVTFALMCVLMCCLRVARKVPTNYILLGIFTLCESYLVSFISAFYDPTIVVLAAFLTATLTFVLTLYACTTKSDFTTMGGLLFILGWGLFTFGFLLILMWTGNPL
mmetsp:Transcript_26309/g.23178  ORF Transcript_26309/g.23178 Transcript_26309/m.23178 type:complete len:144 (+) Transcript_26309:162-593(+)